MPTEAEFLASPMGQAITQDALDAELKAQGHWQGRYRLLMKLGSRMPSLDATWHQSDAEVAGCESATWLHHREIEGRHYFLADSEARIVRGLLVLVLAACNGLDSAALSQVDLDRWFAELGLADHLSPSRASGLNAVVQSIRKLGH
ncbi:SufE family protein [Marinobacter hydrocarbonoclasticus]|nr:SufE family protein [Marinobacter nauticus]